jgi:hypothetical protein
VKPTYLFRLFERYNGSEKGPRMTIIASQSTPAKHPSPRARSRWLGGSRPGAAPNTSCRGPGAGRSAQFFRVPAAPGP